MKRLQGKHVGIAEDERPIWGIHMGRDHATRPIDEGYIAIGWSHVGDLAKIPNDREAFKAIIAKTYQDIKTGAIPVVAGTLYKFTYEMRRGDRVVYPSKIGRKINLVFVDGGYFYKSSGRPEARLVPVVLPRALLHADHGCDRHPAFPAPLVC